MTALTNIVIIFTIIYKISSAAETYRAAVVEYSPDCDANEPVENIFNRSVSDYVKYIEDAGKEGVDIIVFPEIGLSGLCIPEIRSRISKLAVRIPSVEDNITPCNDSSTVPQLQQISCAAARNKVYVVINLQESYDCRGEKSCADNGEAYYNTNVVFDRNGKLIARYRKVNLWFEPGFNTTSTPEFVTFETDFDVKFGTFVCFDVLFKTPAIDLVTKYGVNDFVFPVAWFSQLPFITALQVHSSWAHRNNVALLSAGFNNPKGAGGGSGIFVGKHILQQYFPMSRGNKMLIADVPKHHFRENYKHELSSPLESTEDIQLVVSKQDLSKFLSIPIQAPKLTTTLCQNDLCCDFLIDGLKYDENHMEYRAVILNGMRRMLVVDHGVQICAIVACENNEISSCGSWNRTTNTGAKFSSISIKGNFTSNENSVQFPSTVNTRLLPLQENYYELEHKKNFTKITLKNLRNDIMTFGIMGRKYDKDHWLDMEYVLENQAEIAAWMPSLQAS